MISLLNSKIPCKPTGKGLGMGATVTLTCFLGAGLNTSAQAEPVNIFDVPLFITVNMPPNLVATLDTSGSMDAAHTPDGIGSLTTTKRYKAPSFNGMYYNPKVQYDPPVKFDGTTASTSFTAAHLNGFITSRGTSTDSSSACNPKGVSGQKYSPVNLSNNYAAATDYSLSTNSQTCANADGSTTTTPTSGIYSQSCTIDFDNNSSSDRIQVEGGCSGLATYISGISGQLSVSGSNCSGTTPSNRNGNYTVNSYSSGSNEIYIGNPWGNDCDNKTVTISFNYTISTTSTTYPAYYYLFYTDAGIAKPAGCSSPEKDDDDCYKKIIVGTADDTYKLKDGSAATQAQKEQNFANWYSFYRVRTLALVSAADLAFRDLPQDIRVAWQNLNTCNSFSGTNCPGQSGTNYDNRIRALTGTHRENFFKWLFDIKTASGTPLRIAAQRVGEYFKTASGANNPYAENPQVSAGTEYTCRKNFHLLMTDGEWNTISETGLNSYGNLDNTLPTGSTYPDGTVLKDASNNVITSAQPPYKDANSDSLSDVILHYWQNDLRTDLADEVDKNIVFKENTPTKEFLNPKNDPATWQHLVTYTVGLGLTGSLTNPSWGGSTYAGDYPALAAGTKSWPSTGTTQGKVYDLWHGALNSRGQFFSVESPSDLVTAFKSVIASVAENNAASAAAAANSTNTQSGSALFQAQFDPVNWIGHIYRFNLDINGLVTDQNGNGVPGEASDNDWDAATKIPAAGSRNIYTYNGTGGVPFLWGSLTSFQQALLKKTAETDADGEDRLNWLRGATDKETRFTGGKFRDRTVTVLGDTINSDPIFTRGEDFGYGDTTSGLSEKSTYKAFVDGKTTGPTARLPMLYAGANDGMLHGYRADSGDINSGRELMAYVPVGVFQNLKNLSEPSYAHQYYVDGSPTVNDAYITVPGDGTQNWRTVLLGGLNKGGKSIFALNISNPTTFGANDVLWEYTGLSTDTGSTDVTDADGMGLTYSEPQVARLKYNDKWVAIFGNGYNSVSERAFLYIVDLETGALIKKIPTNTATSNGLSSVTLYDNNDDKITDAVYAGDLQGNLWEFDLSANDVASWGVSNGGNPLFTAVNNAAQAQPITAAPQLSKHSDGGVMVYFGTGRYLAFSDVTNNDVQSFYAIWDKPSASTTVTRTDLVAQTIDLEDQIEFTDPGGSIQNLDVRLTSANTVDYATKRGWYMDLVPPSPAVADGERVISQPLIKDERVIFLTALPSDDACNAGGDSWLMELDLISGARTGTSAFDVNNDNKFDDKDLLYAKALSGVKSPAGMGKEPVWLETDVKGVAVKETSVSKGKIWTLKNRSGAGTPPAGGGGTVDRLDWQQIQ